LAVSSSQSEIWSGVVIGFILTENRPQWEVGSQKTSEFTYFTSRILYLSTPEGTVISTSSPGFLPRRALPIGDSFEILPSSGIVLASVFKLQMHGRTDRYNIAFRMFDELRMLEDMFNFRYTTLSETLVVTSSIPR
jgi:hypothetical protein